MAHHNKPENALKRAQELVNIGHLDSALGTLREVLTSKRFRSWQTSMEDVMELYLSICVDVVSYKNAKEGLHQYRTICQLQNAHSLETVIRHFLQKAEDKLAQAQVAAEQARQEIEEQHGNESSESSILRLVTAEGQKERAEKKHLGKWIKFVWESYRAVLELLRSNPKLEQLYQDTARATLRFCSTYNRKTEFHRLSEMLRNHLANLQKHQPTSQNQLNIASPDTQLYLLETRFEQLNTAVQMEMWQEAFRTVEDLQGLMSTVKKGMVKPQMMANYYQQLALIFLVSENYLYHAYAWLKFYGLSKNQNKNLSAKDLQIMASQVLVASLAVPVATPKDPNRAFTFDVQKEKKLRLSALLGVSVPLSREMLLTELAAKNIPAAALPELHEIYANMEVKFHPLTLCRALKPTLDWIQEHTNLKQYTGLLQKRIFQRYLQQLSKVYKTVKLETVFAQAESILSPSEMEKVIVEAVRDQLVDARLDHQNKSIHFGSQVLESKIVREQLTLLSQRLEVAIEMIHPERKTSRQELKKQVQVTALQQLEKERAVIVERTAVIEERKEKQEQIEKLKARLAQLYSKLEAEQAPKEVPKPTPVAAPKGFEEPKPAPVVSHFVEPQQQIQQQQPQQQPQLAAQPKVVKKDEKEFKEKMEKLATTLDHFERARREEELPLLKQWYDQSQQAENERWAQQKEKFLENHRQAHAKQLKEKERLSKMLNDKQQFEDDIMNRRKAVHDRVRVTEEEHNRKLQDLINKERDRLRQEQLAKLRLEAIEKHRQEVLRKQQELKRKEEEEARRREEELKRKNTGPSWADEQDEDGDRPSRSPPRGGRAPVGGRDRRSRSPPQERGAYVPPSMRSSGGARSPPRRRSRSPPSRRSRSPPRDRYVPPTRRSAASPPRGRSPPRSGGAAGGDKYVPPTRRSPPRRSPPRRSPPRSGGGDRYVPPRRRSPSRSPPRRSGRWSPPRRGASPPRRGSSPPRRGASPPRRGASPPRRGASPPRRGASPPRRGASPPRSGGRNDGRAPRRDDPPRQEDDGFTVVGRRRH